MSGRTVDQCDPLTNTAVLAAAPDADECKTHTFSGTACFAPGG